MQSLSGRVAKAARSQKLEAAVALVVVGRLLSALAAV